MLINIRFGCAIDRRLVQSVPDLWPYNNWDRLPELDEHLRKWMGG